jgi:hypothetical protein
MRNFNEYVLVYPNSFSIRVSATLVAHNVDEPMVYEASLPFLGGAARPGRGRRKLNFSCGMMVTVYCRP